MSNTRILEVGRGGLRAGYLPQLDGLRALAISLVFVHHAVFPLAFGGQIGVDVFFALSGFLITTVLLREIADSGDVKLRNFYLRRIIRLYPALLVAMLLLFVPGLLLAQSTTKFLWETAAAVTYTTPYQILVDGGGDIWRHTWSLGIEELFYLAWPVILVNLKRRVDRFAPQMLMVAGLLALAALLFAKSNTGMFLRMGGMLLGCALALYLERTPNARFGKRAAVSGLALLVGAVLVGTNTRLEMVAASMAAVATLAIIAHLTTDADSVITRALSLRPLTYAGRISYELYLFHFPLLVIGSWLIGGTQSQAAYFAVPLAVLFSAVTHRLLSPAQFRWRQLLPHS